MWSCAGFEVVLCWSGNDDLVELKDLFACGGCEMAPPSWLLLSDYRALCSPLPPLGYSLQVQAVQVHV